jgi:DNA repair protein RadC
LFAHNFNYGEPVAKISPKGMGIFIMNLFNQNIAEVSLSYSSKIKAANREKISSSTDACVILKNFFHHKFPGQMEHRENSLLVLLNRANKVLGISVLSQGGVSGTVMDVKLIFQNALKANASSIILCHNHPSGNINPSNADISITQKIKDGAALLDISLLDHLILTDDSYLSFSDEGLI